MSSTDATPQPPQPPEFKRRLQFHLTQLVGVPLLALLPILALFGVFGVTRSEASAQNDQLELQVSYPSRIRYWMTKPLEVEVRNLTDAPLELVTVSIDTRYLSAFRNVQIEPEPTRINAAVHQVDLTEVQPGETRLVSIEVQADAYWSHEGTIGAATAEGEAAQVQVTSFVIP